MGSHSTAEWAGQQIVEAFSEGESKTYVIRDGDKIYGEEFRRRLRSLSMKEVISGFESPWQNAYVGRCTRFLNRKPSAELWPENAAPKVGRWKERCRLFNLFWFLDAFPFPKLTFQQLADAYH